MLGVNQTVIMALAMQAITPLVAGLGLGKEVYDAMNTANTGRGLMAGIGITLLAIVLDRLTQSWTRKQRQALRSRLTGPRKTAFFERRFRYRHVPVHFDNCKSLKHGGGAKPGVSDCVAERVAGDSFNRLHRGIARVRTGPSDMSTPVAMSMYVSPGFVPQDTRPHTPRRGRRTRSRRTR